MNFMGHTSKQNIFNIFYLHTRREEEGGGLVTSVLIGGSTCDRNHVSLHIMNSTEYDGDFLFTTVD